MSRSPLLIVVCTLLITLSARAAPAWEAKPLREVAVHPERSAQAQVVSLNTARLSAEIAARIEALPVGPGQVIRRGAVVARLDCRDHEIAADQAQAQLDAAKARARLATQHLDRARHLVGEGFISRELLDGRQAEHEAATAAVAVAHSAVQAARRRVEKCVVRAPFPAIVAERLGQVGEMTSPGSPLVSLIDTSRIEVRAEIQTTDAASLAGAAEIRFGLDGEDYPLRLIRLSPAIDPASRLRQARLRFSGRSAPVGSSGRLLWRDPTMHLPAQLIVRRGGRLGVFVEERGQPRFHPLPAAQEGRPVPAGGLAPDSRIVVRGQGAL